MKKYTPNEDYIVEIDENDLIPIEYKDYDKWTEAYILTETETFNSWYCTDDDRELLDEYGDCVYIRGADGEQFVNDLVRRKDILRVCYKENVLYSGWGYHEPAAGNGLNDLGKCPDYFAKITNVDGEKEEIYLD